MEKELNCVYVVTESVVNDYENCSKAPMIFLSHDDALKELERRYRFAKSKKCFLSSRDKEVEKSDNGFSIWESDYYATYHYDAWITETKVKRSRTHSGPKIPNPRNKGREKSMKGVGLW